MIWGYHYFWKHPYVKHKHWTSCTSHQFMLSFWSATVHWGESYPVYYAFEKSLVSTPSQPTTLRVENSHWICTVLNQQKNTQQELNQQHLETEKPHQTLMSKLKGTHRGARFNTKKMCAIEPRKPISWVVESAICAMVKSRYIGDGHPTFNRNPYKWVYKPLLLGWWPSPIIWK